MLKKALVASVALAVSGGASADAFLFNPAGTGAGGAVSATSIDWAQGNVLNVGGVPSAVGDLIGNYFQANLNSFLSGSTPVYTNTSGGHYFTAVAYFQEYAISVSTDVGANVGTAVFDNTYSALLPGGPKPDTATLPNYFRICVQSGVATDLTGAGFACTDANAILTAKLVDIVGANTTVNPLSPTVPPPSLPTDYALLDQFGSEDWSQQRSVTSTGAANIKVEVLTVNAGYFPDLLVGSILTTSLTNTSLVTPYNQQNPSYCFSADGKVSSTSGTSTCSAGTVQAFGTLGNVNGGSFAVVNMGTDCGNSATAPKCNFIFQADANTSFTVQRRVPEPGTLGLLGLGLAGLSLVARRRRTA